MGWLEQLTWVVVPVSTSAAAEQEGRPPTEGAGGRGGGDFAGLPSTTTLEAVGADEEDPICTTQGQHERRLRQRPDRRRLMGDRLE